MHQQVTRALRPGKHVHASGRVCRHMLCERGACQTERRAQGRNPQKKHLAGAAKKASKKRQDRARRKERYLRGAASDAAVLGEEVDVECARGVDLFDEDLAVGRLVVGRTHQPDVGNARHLTVVDPANVACGVRMFVHMCTCESVRCVVRDTQNVHHLPLRAVSVMPLSGLPRSMSSTVGLGTFSQL